MRIGSRSLGEFPLDVVRIASERCGRARSYRRDGLMARFGPDIALPDLLVACRHANAGGTSLAHSARGIRTLLKVAPG